MATMELNNESSCKARQTANRVKLLFQVYSEADYIGERVSILEHSWQSYECAKAAGADKYVQIASLLHDVGHMLGSEAGFGIGMDGCGIPNHELIGQHFLDSLGGIHPRVSWLVGNHVNAKRYLVWKYPDYYDKLSDASKTTLRFQGGAFSDEEAKEFMETPGYEAVIDMRSYDEAAKVVGLPKPSILDIEKVVFEHALDTLNSSDEENDFFKSIVASPNQRFVNSSYRLSTEQLRFYEENGYLVIKGHPMITPNKMDLSTNDSPKFDLSIMANDLEKFASEHGSDNKNEKNILVHNEEVTLPNGDKRVQLCRMENFVKANRDWSVISKLVEDICSELFDEPAVLFKDKLNFKKPYGGGFLLHQDATGYKPGEYASRYISAMIAIDPAVNDEVGPLQVVPGRHPEVILKHHKGVIDAEIEKSMKFVPIYVNPGDLVLFSSYIPHKSDANKSNNSRRLAYFTYNKLSEGDFNSIYYKAKLAAFQDGTAGPISFNDDFGGVIV